MASVLVDFAYRPAPKVLRRWCVWDAPKWAGVARSIRDSAHAVGCFLAISLSFLVYGVLQERMMTVGFGPSAELFRWSLFIVFCNRTVTATIALVILIAQRGTITPVAPVHSYAAVSFGNLVASTCQYDSLKYVNFALQTLAKCCKMLPVMLWGALIGGKTYSANEMATAGMVLLGCGTFIFSGSVASSAVRDTANSSYILAGSLLLLMYLAFDGFASTWQDTLFAGYEMDTSNQVLYTTACSAVFSAIVLTAFSDMTEALAFLRRHPEAWMYIMAVSSVAALIQYFVSYTIKTYGALNFATIMTARQFMSIIASAIIFEHPFTMCQWAGTALVFASLTYRVSNKHAERSAATKGPAAACADSSRTSAKALYVAGNSAASGRAWARQKVLFDPPSELETGSGPAVSADKSWPSPPMVPCPAADALRLGLRSSGVTDVSQDAHAGAGAFRLEGTDSWLSNRSANAHGGTADAPVPGHVLRSSSLYV